MKRIMFVILAMVVATALVAAPVLAADYQSGDKVTTTGENTLAWTGQGATGGELNTVECDESNTGYLLWIFTYDGGDQAYNGTTPYLVLGGTGSGTYYPTMASGNEFHFVTPYYVPDNSTLTAVVDFYTFSTGNGQYNLVISHGCPGGTPPTPQAELTVVKFFDANANGKWDFGEPLLDDWYFTIDGALYSTPFDETVDPGTYLVDELMPNQPGWVASGITVVGTSNYTVTNTTEVEVTLQDKDAVTIYFGNYCLHPSGGLTLGFWSNKNGQKLVGADDLALLVSLNLRKANGDNFDPNSYSQFRTWILAADATNMAYMLSAQLAAMELNVFNGVVDGNAFYIPYGGTINELMIEANTALGVDGHTIAGDPNRGYQQTLKNYLDALNNGALVIPSVPCPYTFTLPG
jgi:hypothetical protein